MKNKIFTVVITFIFSLASCAQSSGGSTLKKDDKKECKCCWNKEKRDSLRFSPKYGIWECGRDQQIVDCNEALELDQNSNTIIHKRTGKPFTGDCETCHFNGIRERVVHFEGGKEEGTDTTFYMSGCPKVIRQMVYGEFDGEITYFYDSIGTEAWREHYMADKKNGQQIYYDKGHKPKKIEHYYNGVLNGNKKVFFPGTFNVKTDVNYKMNVLHGSYKSYVQNDTGAVMVINFNYVEGLKDGIQESYYDMGAVLATEEYKKGLRHGPTTAFFADGTVMKSEFYVKDLKHGEFKHFMHDGKLQWEAEYKKGKLISEMYYDEFGNPIEPEKPEGSEEGEDVDQPKKKKKKKKKKKSKKKK